MSLDRLRAHRRALHRIPERGLLEFKTKAYLLSVLEPLGPDRLDQLGDTALKAVFFCGRPGAKTLAFRADMDALPVREETGLPFCSGHEGFMHACGHDGHMALLLTFCEYVAAHREELGCNVVALFQPGEENYLGARDFVRLGALEAPRVDEVYGGHLMPSLPLGSVGLSAGPVMAGNLSIALRVRGVSAHGASPQNGVDGVLAACQALVAIQAALSRLDPTQPCLASFGSIHGGSVRNALAEEVVADGVMRYYDQAHRDAMLRTMERAAQGAAGALGATAELWRDEKEYPPVINDEACVRKAAALLEGRVAQTAQMISEDFSCYLNQRPGCFAFIGCGQEGRTSPLHSSRFDFDEAALLPMLQLYIRLSRQA